MHHDAGSAEHKWKHLIEAVEEFGQGFTVFDRDLHLILCNNRFLEMLDFPVDLVHAGTVFADFMRYNAARGEYGGGDIEALVAERVQRALEFTPHCFERTRPNGTVVEVRGTPLPGGGFVTIYSDITQRRRTEEKILRQTEYLRSVLDNLPQGISVFDENLRLKFWNSRLLDMLDLPAEAVYPDAPFEDLVRIQARRGEYGPGDPEGQVRERRELARMFLSHRLERTRPNGRTHLAEGRPMRLGERLIGFITTYTDITDHMAVERALHDANARSEAALATKNLAMREQRNFLAMVSHEFRTPLSIITGAASILSQYPGNPEDTRVEADKIHRAVVRMERMIESLLADDWLENASSDFRHIAVDLGALITAIAAEFRETEPGRPITARCVDGVAVSGDPELLRVVITNLIGNACKYSPRESEVTVRLDMADGMATMAVIDHGMGIRPEDVGRVFEKFYRAHDAERKSGSGIGLYLVKRIVTLHGGSVEVASAERQGTTFTARLPLAV